MELTAPALFSGGGAMMSDPGANGIRRYAKGGKRVFRGPGFIDVYGGGEPERLNGESSGTGRERGIPHETTSVAGQKPHGDSTYGVRYLMSTGVCEGGVLRLLSSMSKGPW